MNNGNTIKSSKLQSLMASLESAKKSLAEATARLQPAIDAEQERVNGLQKAYEKASKASAKAYEAYHAAVNEATHRLFPIGATTALEAAIKAHVSAQFPHADTMRLAGEFKGKKIAADAGVVAAAEARNAAHNQEEQTRRVYWTATSPGSKLSKMVSELETFKDHVAELEKEIERLPRYRQAAKDRREQERQEKLVDDQTRAAREMMADFHFE